MARYRFAVTLLSYLVVGLLLSACGPATPTSSSAVLASTPSIFPTQEETPAPDFTLIDQDSQLVALLNIPDLEEYLEFNSIPEAEAYLNRLVETATKEGWRINARWEDEAKVFLLDKGPTQHLALLSGEDVSRGGNKGAVIVARGEDRNGLVMDAWELLGIH